MTSVEGEESSTDTGYSVNVLGITWIFCFVCHYGCPLRPSPEPATSPGILLSPLGQSASKPQPVIYEDSVQLTGEAGPSCDWAGEGWVGRFDNLVFPCSTEGDLSK